MRIRQIKGEPVCPSVTHRQNESASDTRLMNKSMLSRTSLGHNLIIRNIVIKNEAERIIQCMSQKILQENNSLMVKSIGNTGTTASNIQPDAI